MESWLKKTYTTIELEFKLPLTSYQEMIDFIHTNLSLLRQQRTSIISLLKQPYTITSEEGEEGEENNNNNSPTKSNLLEQRLELLLKNQRDLSDAITDYRNLLSREYVVDAVDGKNNSKVTQQQFISILS